MNTNSLKFSLPASLVALGALLISVSVLNAAGVNWTNTGNGNWEDGTNWNTGTAPATGDAVAITNTTATISMTNGSSDTWLTVGSLTVGGSGAGGATLVTGLTNDYTTFTVSSNAIVGNSAVGTTNGHWNIEGGSVLVGGAMTIGNAVASASGKVTVANGAALTNTTATYIGYVGFGSLTASNGGSVKTGTLAIGYSGATAEGQVLIDGGSVTATNVSFGLFSGAKGKLTIAGAGTLTSTGSMQLGASAGSSGEVVQSNGLVSIGVNLLVGANATSTNTSYKLYDGVLNAGTTYIGYSGTGEMIQYGGTASQTSLFVGSQSGSTNSLLKVLGGTNLVNGTSTIGYQGSGGMEQSGGLVQQKSLIVGSLSGSDGTLKVLGGTNLVTGGTTGVAIGNALGSTGEVIIDGGSLVITNNGGSGYLAIGKDGQGTLTLSNGLVLVDTLMYVGHNNTGNGLLNIHGGTNIAAGIGIAPYNAGNVGYVDVAGAGVLEITGVNVIIGSATSQGTLVVRDGGTLQFNVNPSAFSRGNASTFMVTNGTVAYKGVGNADLATLRARITTLEGGSRLRLEDATNTSNLNTFTLGGSGNFEILEMKGASSQFNSTNLTIVSGGRLDVTGGTSTLAATITNSGTISVSNAHAIYSSNVVNLGAYVSDPSTNTFNGNFIVGASGYVKAEAGDIYAFGADYILQSTNGTQFDMSNAQIIFASGGYGITTGSTNHVFDLTGSGAVDLGDNWPDISQLASNFSVGVLTIQLDNQLTLSGGATNALYVGLLDLSGWDTSPGALTNTLQSALNLTNLTLYYDKNLAGNDYLGGNIYDLWGGSELRPVPEPSTVIMLLLGLTGLILFRNKFSRKQGLIHQASNTENS